MSFRVVSTLAITPPQGDRGDPGVSGARGPLGRTGPPGRRGQTGPVGENGPKV